jgi:hypothetical protein
MDCAFHCLSLPCRNRDLTHEDWPIRYAETAMDFGAADPLLYDKTNGSRLCPTIATSH